jgi:hypothetical protein
MAKRIKTINYLIIFILFFIVMVLALFINNKYLITKNDNDVVLSNIALLNDKLEQVLTSVRMNNSKVELQDRLDVELVAEFGDDTEFLNKIALLKKKIIKRQLESEVIKLENEKVARDNIDNNADYGNHYQDKNIARNLFDVLMINATNKSAVVQIKNDIIAIKIGDNVRGFKVKDITADNVVITNPNGEDDILTLNYLTQKNYDIQGVNDVK